MLIAGMRLRAVLRYPNGTAGMHSGAALAATCMRSAFETKKFKKF